VAPEQLGKGMMVVRVFIIITLLVLVEEEQVRLVQTAATMLLVQAVQVAHHRLLDRQLLMQAVEVVESDSLEERLVPVVVVEVAPAQISLTLDHLVHQTPVEVVEVGVAIMGLVVAVVLV
jgi:hypothetical protein